jgi:uncharacterized iron-regulated membrane protein
VIRKSARHKLHRTVGIIIVPLLLLSALTGFFRANHKWFWEEGYKKKKNESTFAVTDNLISVQQLMGVIDSVTSRKNTLKQLKLKEEAGRLYYELQTENKKNYLVDAETGRIASPIDSILASAIAREYIKEAAAVKSAHPLPDYVLRKEKTVRPVYEVVFANDINSHIYLDLQTAEIVEDVDDNRRFGMWMVKLHDYDFFNSKRSISSVVGLGVVLLGITGIWIYRRKRKKKRKMKHRIIRVPVNT